MEFYRQKYLSMHPFYEENKYTTQQVLNKNVLTDGLHMQFIFQENWHTIDHSLTFDRLTCEALQFISNIFGAFLTGNL